MLTGQLPLGRFAPPSQASAAPRALDRVVSRCLESDPAFRFPDVAAFCAALDAACRSRRPQRASAVIAAGLLGGTLLILAATRPWQSGDVAAGPATDQAAADANVGQTDPPDSTDEAQPEPVADQPTDEQGADADDGEQQAEAPWLAISNVVIRSGQGPALSITFDCRHETPASGAGADLDRFELFWIVESASGRRMETPLGPFDGASSQSIEGSMLLERGDRWPMDVFVERVDPSAPTGRRRASNLVRVQQPEFPSIGRPRLGPFR
jgi:hypothetical protein